MANDPTVSEFMKHKKSLRKTDVKLNDKFKISKERQQAQDFIDDHNKRELDAIVRIYQSESFADMMDWLIFRNAMFDEGGTFKTFPTEFYKFMGEIKKIRDSSNKID